MADASRESELDHKSSGLAGVVHRNIDALVEVRKQFERDKSWHGRIADRITRLTGSMTFLCLQALVFAFWLLWNSGLGPPEWRWDPFPFVLLAMGASVEAIFLSTFVLISQNRMATLEDQRAELDLQITLLSEHEITHLITLVDAIANRLGIKGEKDPTTEELKKDVAPEVVLREIAYAEQRAGVATGPNLPE